MERNAVSSSGPSACKSAEEGRCEACVFYLFELGKCGFPSLFQLGRHQTIVWINPIELTLGQRGLIAQSFQVLLLSVSELLSKSVLGGDRGLPSLPSSTGERAWKKLSTTCRSTGSAGISWQTGTRYCWRRALQW